MITYSQERLQRYALASVYAFERKGYCSHCGGQLKGTEERCPHCKRMLTNDSGNWAFGYFALQTTDRQGHQVERYFQARMTFRVKQPARIDHIIECFRITLQNGRLQCIGRRAGQSFFGCVDYFSSDHTFVKRRIDSRQINLISTANIDRYLLAPKTWNEWQSRHGLVRWQLFMKNPHTETLMKMRSPLLDKVYDKRDVDWYVERYWPQIKIANRHGYKIADFGYWQDTITMLKDLGKDIHSPKYVCPTDIRALHDWCVAKREQRFAEERARRDREQLMQNEQARQTYTKRLGKWIGIAFNSDIMQAHVLQNVDEFIDEAKAMHNCVFSCKYWKKEDCIIFSVTDKHGNRLATVEYRPSTNTIVQCYANCNKTPKNQAQIEQFILDGIRKAA